MRANSTPSNGHGGYMRGAEFGTALGGEELHPTLQGFGALLNASYTESSIDPDGPGGSDTDTLPGLSTVVANATLYYENHGFSARISQRFRDPYRGEYSYIFGQRSYRYTLNERQVDLQLSYDFPETGAMTGPTLMFQVNNLNNEPFRTEVSDSNGLGCSSPRSSPSTADSTWSGPATRCNAVETPGTDFRPRVHEATRPAPPALRCGSLRPSTAAFPS